MRHPLTQEHSGLPFSSQAVQRLKFNNWLIVAIDEELRDYCKEHGINHYYRPVKVRGARVERPGPGHVISPPHGRGPHCVLCACA